MVGLIHIPTAVTTTTLALHQPSAIEQKWNNRRVIQMRQTASPTHSQEEKAACCSIVRIC